MTEARQRPHQANRPAADLGADQNAAAPGGHHQRARRHRFSVLSPDLRLQADERLALFEGPQIVELDAGGSVMKGQQSVELGKRSDHRHRRVSGTRDGCGTAGCPSCRPGGAGHIVGQAVAHHHGLSGRTCISSSAARKMLGCGFMKPWSDDETVTEIRPSSSKWD
jgi:hypothetical protein